MESEALAQHARGTAEQLINRMLYDLRSGLEAAGQVELLEAVSEDAERYFAELPPAFRSDASERERSTMLNNRGDVFIAAGNTEAALEQYRAALGLRRERLEAKEHDLDRRADVAISLERVADALSGIGDFDAAIAALEESLALRRGGLSGDREADAVTETSSSGADRRDREISVTLAQMGDIRLAQENVEAAERLYRESLGLLRRAAANGVRSDGTSPSSSLGSVERDLAAALVRLGDLMHQSDRPDEAIEAYGESLAQLRSLQSDSAPTDASLLRDIAAVSARLGGVVMTSGAGDQAQSYFEQSCVALESLIATDPKRKSWRSSLAAVHSQAGDAALELEDLASAAEHLRKASDLLEALIDEESGAAGDHLVVEASVAQYKLAGISRREGRFHDSVGHYDQALDWLGALRDSGRLEADKEDWIALLETERAELQPPPDPREETE